MKRILLCLLVIFHVAAKAQVYNNEWIDYNKTYYKFKIDSSAGLRRIPQTALAAIGLGNTPAEHFQLWRNGVEVPIYTSVASGSFSTSDYIEFWGEMNDGKPDRALYRKPEFLLNDKWSLETDSATYFLTVNPTGGNLRLTNAANNVAGNTLPAEPYFMYTASKYFRDRIHGGYAVNVDGTYLYSSAYDRGEGWASADIETKATTGGVNYGIHNFTFNNLFVSSTGPSPRLKATVSGNAVNARGYKVSINGDSVLGNNVDYFNYSTDSSSFNLSLISSGTATLSLTNKASVICFLKPNGTTECQVDRLVIHKYELTYPRQFNFGGAFNFEFTLPASSNGNYLEISGFSYGATPPVLYDLTNGKRYVADVSAAPLVKIVLEPSSTERRLVLATLDPAKTKPVTTFTQKVFTNYTLAQNQADYLIVSNPLLFNGANGSNPVEEYRAYRSSTNGGGYNAKIYLVDELIDQFAFGIKAHPAGIRNFIHFARNNFSKAPQHVLLIGKGVTYVEQRNNESHALMQQLNLVPTFGVPASDNLLSSVPGSAIPEIPIGRISAVNAAEVSVYLEKIKQMEAAQATTSPKISDKAWMKNVVHVVGAGGDLGKELNNYMNLYGKMISDSLYGGVVYSFSKETASPVEILSSKYLENLFAEGISLLTYFGHSGSTTLSYNIEDPEKYHNAGKYPMFVALGCNAGSMFSFTTSRTGLSELYVLAPQRGTIGFLASSHYGIVLYMDVWNRIFYKKIGRENYGKSIGEAIKGTAVDVFKLFNQEDFYLRSTVEQMQLHGDPAFQLNGHAKADYAIEDPMVKVNPNFISVASDSFNVQAKFMNLGRAEKKNIVIKIERKYPDNSVGVVFRDTIAGTKFMDSISVNIPIDPVKDKGTNSINVIIDADNDVDEIYETNNSVTKEFVVYEDEAKPVYPYNFSIVNQQGIKFYGSTANLLSKARSYKIEIDTTEQFSSTLKVSQTISSAGGVLEFSPGIHFLDSTVYYWRLATVPDSGEYKWNTFSFTYIQGSETGFAQSHYYQHMKSALTTMKLDSVSHQWQFGDRINNVFVKNAIFGISGFADADFSVSINGNDFIRSACVGYSLIFNVINPVNFEAELNLTGKYGSATPCAPTRRWNYEYSYMTSASRKKIMDFMDSIPEGSYVVVRNILNSGQTSGFVDEWKGDTSLYGSNNSLYHKLKDVGFNDIDSFYKVRIFAFIYRKGGQGFEPIYTVSQGMFDKITLNTDIASPASRGNVTSPLLGRAKEWKEFLWRGTSIENVSTDVPLVDIIGVRDDGSTATLFEDIPLSQQQVDISSIDANIYPYLKLVLKNIDSVNYTPYQLKYWKLLYKPVPEGVLSPNLKLNIADTITQIGDMLNVDVAFKNVTSTAFDSLKVKLVIIDKSNTSHTTDFRLKPLTGNDTLNISTKLDTKKLAGLNTLYIEANPDNDQPEQYKFNNYLYKDFFVKSDTIAPLLDVTFDNVHILNRDIVSPKPNILIKLKDENLKYLLADTSLVKVHIKYPDKKEKPFYFDGVTMRFNPAQAGSENEATINLNPSFEKDGEYELIVTAQDGIGNKAGAKDYRIAFQVINKPMISNMLNYPNPFTTSTAFVFTLTGSEVPQNIRIQILTVTGKVVKEITKEELGPLRIGRNITEYKWDGTDQYGQKLGNGVYLYRVITNLNGKSLDKYKSDNDDTDKYFNKGYGKMYLMR